MEVIKELLIQQFSLLLTIIVLSASSVLLAILDIARMYVRIAEARDDQTKIVRITKTVRHRIITGILVYITVAIVLMYRSGYPLW